VAAASSYDADMDTSPDRRLDALLSEARLQIDAVDAEWLLAHALRQPRTWLYAHARDIVDAAASERFAALVACRAVGEPVAYLTGKRGFWTFALQVTPDTLIPRPETELLVELALARLPPDRDLRIADLGTGSGAIALALTQERRRADVLATDASEAALVVARTNAAALGVDNIRFRRGDWCAALGDERFDLIASNPPYIAADDPHLAEGDLRFEPAAALASGHDGLEAIRAIVSDAPGHLVPDGWLLLEHGMEQGAAVRALLKAAGLVDITTGRDLENRERVTSGRRPS
jgi:release factor glutamine methyltransferase